MGKRNPNGYGCVTKLKGNRSRPWVAKVTIYDEHGHAKQSPIGYAETEEKANILLAEYNNNPWDIDREKVTLIVLYQRWSEIKLPRLGNSNQAAKTRCFTAKFIKVCIQTLFKILRCEIPKPAGISDARLY